MASVQANMADQKFHSYIYWHIHYFFAPFFAEMITGKSARQGVPSP